LRLPTAIAAFAALQALLAGATLAVTSDGKNLANKDLENKGVTNKDRANGHAGRERER
jgi:hypothetical protein